MRVKTNPNPKTNLMYKKKKTVSLHPMATLARRTELMGQFRRQNVRPLEEYNMADVMADIEAQIRNEQSKPSAATTQCSAAEEKVITELRKKLRDDLKESDWQHQDEVAAQKLKGELESENTTPDEKIATTELIAKTQEIVSNLVTTVTDGLKQSVEEEKPIPVPTAPRSTFFSALPQSGLVQKCLSVFSEYAKKPHTAVFAIFWFSVTRIFNILRYLINSPQFVLFLYSAWRLLRQHFCQFLAIKYGYDLKNYFARKMNPQTFYEGFLSKAIGQYFESSYFNNIFDTIATAIPELLQQLIGGLVGTVMNYLHGTLEFLKKLGTITDIIGKVMTFLINLFIAGLKLTMQLVFPQIIANWADSGYFDLIIHTVFFAGCYGDIFGKGGAALMGAGAAYAGRKKSSPEKKKKSSPKSKGFGGGKKPKDDDDSDDEGPGDLKIQEPQSREKAPAPKFPFPRTSAFPPGGPTEDENDALSAVEAAGFQFEPPETKSGIPPPPFFAPRVPLPTAAPEDLSQPAPQQPQPSETLIEKIGKGLNAWNIFTTVATVLQYKTQETMRKPKG